MFGESPYSPYGAPVRKYEPKWEKDIEVSPDRRCADGGFWAEVDPNSADIRMVLSVRGLGAITMRASTGHTDGRLRFEGLSTFTCQQIQFANEIDDPTEPRLE